jgi:hypothetical protein
MVFTGTAKENAAAVLFSWVETCDEIANLMEFSVCVWPTGSSGRVLTNLVLLLLRCPQHVKKISLYSLVVVSVNLYLEVFNLSLYTCLWLARYKLKILTEHKLGF